MKSKGACMNDCCIMYIIERFFAFFFFFWVMIPFDQFSVLVTKRSR